MQFSSHRGLWKSEWSMVFSFVQQNLLVFDLEDKVLLFTCQALEFWATPSTFVVRKFYGDLGWFHVLCTSFSFAFPISISSVLNGLVQGGGLKGTQSSPQWSLWYICNVRPYIFNACFEFFSSTLFCVNEVIKFQTLLYFVMLKRVCNPYWVQLNLTI